MADVFGEAARLLMSGVAPDRLLQGLDDEAKRRLAFLALASCDAYPVGWLESEGPPPPLDVLPSYPVRMHVEPGPPHQDVASRVHILLTACKGGLDGECSTCGACVCPYGEPLHFHHDGCPACSTDRLPPPAYIFDESAIPTHAEAREAWAHEARTHASDYDPDTAKAQDAIDQDRDAVAETIASLRRLGHDVEHGVMENGEPGYRLHEPARTDPRHDAACACMRPST